ncbi:hypothetical protein [Saccharopolyspora endophytica]|uniref:Uncharacterized protein n=1 Tax=Saccharopolyspora endophytica TaxID=543886 RepID=A0ABS5DCC7_9PSEU|nr:hypothetical protein [Saccharopolyspora endophytica]MBQ0923928.1 hypothetical protein [Saccharopolyspora endophytica]
MPRIQQRSASGFGRHRVPEVEGGVGHRRAHQAGGVEPVAGVVGGHPPFQHLHRPVAQVPQLHVQREHRLVRVVVDDARDVRAEAFEVLRPVGAWPGGGGVFGGRHERLALDVPLPRKPGLDLLLRRNGGSRVR